MPRTDKEIAEYVRYYAKNGQRKWAMEMMTKTEGKTAEEIEHICKVENGRIGGQTMLQKKPPKYSDEFLDAVAADRDAGMSHKDIADKYKMPAKTINSIMAVISYRKKKAAEAEMKQQEPVVESDVKIFLPGEEQAKPEEKKKTYKKPEIIELPYSLKDCIATIPESQQLHAPAKNLWFALRDELRAFALGIFGAGTELIEENVSSKYHDVNITVETPDGDRILLSIVKEKGLSKE
ncbi:MAG: hypothetical protein J6N15_04070 [Ruminiclostridium sp.]|nr:hypothetical protein [Ruminiclostridium sp.]